MPNLIASTREHSDHEALKYPTPEHFATPQQLKSGPKFRASSAVREHQYSIPLERTSPFCHVFSCSMDYYLSIY